LELLLKIEPVNEVEMFRLRFMFKFAGCPVASTSGLHVGHHPDDFGEIIFEGFWAKADVSSARCQESLACRMVTAKLRGNRRLKEILLPPGGGSGCR